MPKFSAIPDLCRQDGICASVCPAHCIKGPKGQFPVMRPEAEQACIACGHCMAFCPHGAARVDALDPAAMRPIDKKLLPGPDAVGTLLAARRSIRRFKKAPVPKNLLEQALRATRHAPSAKNRRPARLVVVYEAASMRALGDAIADWLESPAGPGAAMPEAATLARAWRRGLDPLFRGAPHLALAVTDDSWPWAAVDSAIALTYLELGALPLGIGACWAGYVTHALRSHAPLGALVGLKPGEIVQGGQMLGLIALRPTASAPRAPLPETWI